MKRIIELEPEEVNVIVSNDKKKFFTTNEKGEIIREEGIHAKVLYEINIPNSPVRVYL